VQVREHGPVQMVEQRCDVPVGELDDEVRHGRTLPGATPGGRC
jgi:hypothetical protein